MLKYLKIPNPEKSSYVNYGETLVSKKGIGKGKGLMIWMWYEYLDKLMNVIHHSGW